MKTASIQTFLSLARKAKIACESRPSSHEYEAEFDEVLRHVESNPEWRSDFAKLFVTMLSNSSLGPWELICFCMHKMRWDEVRLAAMQEIARNEDHRIKAVMSSVVDSFSDTWRDADLYKRFTPRG